MATKTTKKTTKSVKKVEPASKPASIAAKSRSTSRPVTKTENSASTSTNSSPVKFRKVYIIPVLLIILLGALLYVFRSVFVAATVNGQPISRLSVVRELEKQSGKQAMNSLVTKILIQQEANKQNITVNEKEVDAEIKKIEDNLKQQGQQLDQVLAIQGMSKDQLREQIRLQKAVEKMIGKDIKITDKEVTDYIEGNKESLPQDQDEATLKKDVQERLKQGKLNEKIQTWLQDLQKNAKINYFVQY